MKIWSRKRSSDKLQHQTFCIRSFGRSYNTPQSALYSDRSQQAQQQNWFNTGCLDIPCQRHHLAGLPELHVATNRATVITTTLLETELWGRHQSVPHILCVVSTATISLSFPVALAEVPHLVQDMDSSKEAQVSSATIWHIKKLSHCNRSTKIQGYLCPSSVSCHCHEAPELHRFQLRHRWEQQL